MRCAAKRCRVKWHVRRFAALRRPGDYRTLYMHRKAEMVERTAAAKERIAAAQQQVQEAKESRKAKVCPGAGTNGFI